LRALGIARAIQKKKKKGKKNDLGLKIFV